MGWLVERAYAISWNFLTVKTGSQGTVSGLMTSIVGWVGAIAGILAFIYLVYSGIIYITAGGNPDAAKKGQQGIINAIIGIIIIIFAYFIVTALATYFGSSNSTV